MQILTASTAVLLRFHALPPLWQGKISLFEGGSSGYRFFIEPDNTQQTPFIDGFVKSPTSYNLGCVSSLVNQRKNNYALFLEIRTSCQFYGIGEILFFAIENRLFTNASLI